MRIDSYSCLKCVLKYESKKYGSKSIIKSYIKDPRFRVNFWLRIGQYIKIKNSLGFLGDFVCRLIKNKLALDYGFDTTLDLSIGKGLRIVHLGCIVIHGNSKIGDDLTILNSVNIGQASRNAPNKVPCLGDNIYVGAGSKIIGDVKIGNDVTIGCLTLVNRNFTSGSTVVGIPGRLIEG